MHGRLWSWLLLGLIGVCLAVAGLPPAPAQDRSSTDIDTRAVELLKRMSDGLAGLTEFTVRARHTSDVVLATGETVQDEGVSDVSSGARTSSARTGSARSPMWSSTPTDRA